MLMLAALNQSYGCRRAPRPRRGPERRRRRLDGAASDRAGAPLDARLQPARAEHRDGLSSLELARKLAARGADVNVPQTGREGGTTPFLLATKSLDLPYMQVLLELGADPKLKADDGTTAVMVAAGVGQGQGSAGAAPGSVEEALAALALTLHVGAGRSTTSTRATRRRCTA
jgi:hypothetical protein